LQGIDTKLVKPANVPPFQSYHIDDDDQYADDAFHGHMGDVTVWTKCGAAVGEVTDPTGSSSAISVAGPGGGGGSGGGKAPAGWKPREPGKPDIKISNACSPAAFGGNLQCTIRLINVGDTAPAWQVGFSDLAVPDFGPNWNFPLLLLQANGTDPRWGCSGLPATSLNCVLPGAALAPGKELAVNVFVDISTVTSQPGWQITNTATLVSDGTTASDTVGDTFVLTKTAPSNCQAGGVCTFTISLTNYAARTFNGTLKFSDDLSIGGQLANGVTVTGVWPNQGCAIPAGGILPLEWQCPVTIPSYGIKTFEVDMFIPISSGPASGSIPARNCIVATTPGLAPAPAAAGQQTSGAHGAMLAAAAPAAAPGMVCVDFQIAAYNPVLTPKPVAGLPQHLWPQAPGAGCKGRPDIKITRTSPATFSAPGVRIKFDYQVTKRDLADGTGLRIGGTPTMPGVVDPALPTRW
jgi:hypothetical protein